MMRVEAEPACVVRIALALQSKSLQMIVDYSAILRGFVLSGDGTDANRCESRGRPDLRHVRTYLV